MRYSDIKIYHISVVCVLSHELCVGAGWGEDEGKKAFTSRSTNQILTRLLVELMCKCSIGS